MSMDPSKRADEATRKADDAAKIVIEAAAVQLGKAGERHRNVAQVSDEVEDEMTLATAAATCALIRAENEKPHLDAALLILRAVEAGDMEVAIETR